MTAFQDGPHAAAAADRNPGNGMQDPDTSLPPVASEVPGPAARVPAASVDTVTAPRPGPGKDPDHAPQPWVVRSWRLLLREPSLMVAVAYLFVSFIGLWANFWFYRMFGLPILEYMQASDYLVAGLRDPAYAALLAFSALLALLITWPEFYRARNPQRVAELRGRSWWWRSVFPDHHWLRWQGMGMAPVTGVVFAVFWGMVWACTAYVATRAVNIRDGDAGNRVEVTLAGESAPLPGQAKLLGTTSAFVLLWWPQHKRAEVLPLSAVKRLASLRPPAPAPRAVAPVSARAAGARQTPASEQGAPPAGQRDTTPAAGQGEAPPARQDATP